jgi:hypothetical protein
VADGGVGDSPAHPEGHAGRVVTVRVPTLRPGRGTVDRRTQASPTQRLWTSVVSLPFSGHLVGSTWLRKRRMRRRRTVGWEWPRSLRSTCGLSSDQRLHAATVPRDPLVPSSGERSQAVPGHRPQSPQSDNADKMNPSTGSGGDGHSGPLWTCIASFRPAYRILTTR